MPTSSSLTAFEELYLDFQRKVSAEWHKRMDRLVSGSQATILWKLEYGGPQKASTLAARMDITPGAITSLSDKLISSGYAVRTRDADDRRVVYLEITDQGRELLRQFRVETKSIMEHFFKGISEEDIHHLIRIYEQVLRNIDKEKEVEH